MHMCKSICITNINIHEILPGLISEINVFGIYHLKAVRNIISSQMSDSQISFFCSLCIEENRRPNLTMMFIKGSDGRWALVSEMKRILLVFIEFQFLATIEKPGRKKKPLSYLASNIHCYIINNEEMLSNHSGNNTVK